MFVLMWLIPRDTVPELRGDITLHPQPKKYEQYRGFKEEKPQKKHDFFVLFLKRQETPGHFPQESATGTHIDRRVRRGPSARPRREYRNFDIPFYSEPH
jgi:hypothetical protein